MSDPTLEPRISGLRRTGLLGLSVALGLALYGCGGGGDDDGNDPPGTTLNDPLLSSQWHLKNATGVDIRAAGAWAQGVSGQGLIVAVIDSGLDVSHEDFAGKIVIVPGSDPASGDGDPTSRPEFGDEEPHGTWCAGLAAAAGNNSIGGAGVAYGARVLPIRAISNEGDLPFSEAARVIRLTADNGAAVVNNSWGYVGSFALPDVLRSALDHVTDTGRGGLGTVVIFAAGNDGDLITGNPLATYTRCIAVGSTTSVDVHASYSEVGPELDLVAPGGDFNATLKLFSTDESGLAGANTGRLRAGTYIVGVGSAAGASAYQLRIGLSPPAEVRETEPNNFRQSPQQINYPAQIGGAADGPNAQGDIFVDFNGRLTFSDLYRFTVSSDQTLSMQLSGGAPGTDNDLMIANANGKILIASTGETNSEPILSRIEGDDSGNYWNGFVGTSAAAPVASGVAALVIEANPRLRWPDVMRVLEQTADKVGAGYDSAGHSPQYGFGRVNAEKAVQTAKTTTPSAAKPATPRSFAAWPRAAKPERMDLYWYSAGQAHELRLDRGSVLARSKAEAPRLRRAARAKKRDAAAEPAWLLGARRMPVSALGKLGRDGYETAPAMELPDGTPVWLGHRLVAALPEGASLQDVAKLLARHGLTTDHALGQGEYVLRSAEGGLATLAAANALYESGLFLYAHPDFELPTDLY